MKSLAIIFGALLVLGLPSASFSKPNQMAGVDWATKGYRQAAIEKRKLTCSDYAAICIRRGNEPSILQVGRCSVQADWRFCWPQGRTFRCVRETVVLARTTASHCDSMPTDGPDDVDIEPAVVCAACGRHGADVRPDWESLESRARRQALLMADWSRAFDDPIPVCACCGPVTLPGTMRPRCRSPCRRGSSGRPPHGRRCTRTGRISTAATAQGSAQFRIVR